MNLRIDQTLRCKHRHKAGADDRKRQTKRKNALHQPIFFFRDDFFRTVEPLPAS